MSTNTGNEANKAIGESNQTSHQGWLTKLSLSHWLAIVAIPIGMIGALYLLWHEEKSRMNVYVPAHELPAYYQIQPGDLVQKSYASRSVSSDILKTSQEIAGHYTLIQLPKDQPLTVNQLGVKVNPTCLTDTIAVSLPATPAMTFDGNLKAGDTISITFGSSVTQNGTSLASTVFPNILVLDVKAISQANASPTSIIVIALPETSAKEFATHLGRTTALVSRNLSGKGNGCVM